MVEDDQKIGQMLDDALRADGHQVLWRLTGAEAVTVAAQEGFDLCLLDLGLPDMDGVDVCRALKGLQPDGVVVMLTARRDEMDVVSGLESGADDYLVKPFRMAELLARVRAHLRRGSSHEVTARPLEVDDLVIDVGARRCLLRGAELGLRPKELDLLVRLVRTAGVAVTREQLMADVWDEHWFGSTKTLDVHVAALRQKLADEAQRHEPPARVPAITTLRGFGYRLDPEEPGSVV